MEKLSKINFRQGKYILPAILYPLILLAGYFFIDLFHTEKADIGDSTMQTTEYLNPELPQPKVSDELGGKYENCYVVTALGNLAALQFSEGDLVFATMRFQSREYNGQTYMDIIATELIKK